ncbi:MAG: ferredoxin [Nanoarchaeota archaeon]
MAIKVNKEKCIGCGLCSSICEEVFEMDDNTMKAKVKAQKKIPCVKEAIESCPVEAISG